MDKLPKIRSSNLVLLIALPFLLYLLATSSDYRRSIIAIIGAEPAALEMLVSFGLLLAVLLSGLAAPFAARRDGWNGRIPDWAPAVLLVVHAGVALAVARGGTFDAFVNAVIVNQIDAVRSPDVIPGYSPWQLLAPVLAEAVGLFRLTLTAWSGVALALGLVLLIARQGAVRRWALRFVLVVCGLALVYLLLVAHLGFAAGLFVSLRAVIFAYGAAAVMGLGLAGLLTLRQKRHTLKVFAGAILVFIGLAGFAFLQPQESYQLAGALTGKVAVLPGTPQRLVDVIRNGEFAGAPGPVAIQSVSSPERALAALSAGKVSAILAPAAPADLKVIWDTAILPDGPQTFGVFAVVMAVLLAVLTVSALQHGAHPLAIGAELFVDTVRGIPMLVIILYVGLPLSGALRDASGGGIDLPNFWRGVAAISIGYSAYMAEIFRAGIQSIPRGQIEAAQSLGLSRFRTAQLVVLPQAIKVITPALGNEFIAMLKDTSLLSVLSVRDVTQRMREFQAASFMPFAPFNAAAILYVVLTLAIASALNSFERRLNRNTVR